MAIYKYENIDQYDKNYPMSGPRFKICQTQDKPLRNHNQKLFLPKWWNLANSGHTPPN